jgi:hypothetical protein
MKKYVWVFGANKDGFHGAGGAAFAFTGSYANNWRTHPWCQEAINGGEKKGLMAEWGKARGYQEGRISTLGSYAIQTVVKPGAKRSVPLKEIRRQVEEELVPFMRRHPDWEFVTSRFAAGYGGYTLPEMSLIWALITQEPNGKFAPNYQ